MGKLISFSGIDGSGKSTQVKILEKYLKNKGKRVYVTEKMFGYFLLKPLIKHLRSATKSPEGGPVNKNKNKIYKLWFIPAFFDVWVGYLFEIRPIIIEYDFVIADRFYTDIWANLLYYGYLPDWAFIKPLRYLPKSDIPLLLSVEPKSVLKREKDFSYMYYKQQSKIYKRLAQYVDAYVIDANQSKSQVAKELRTRVQQALNKLT